MRDHESITVDDFRGLVDNGEDESIPQGGFISSQNNKFLRKGVKSREGSALLHTIPAVRRMAIYKRRGEAQRLLILDDVGRIYDSTNPAVPILTIAAMTDFSMVNIFERAYITPHNGIRGLPGEKVYVYPGSGVARQAAGIAPVGFTLTVANSATVGTVESGDRIIGVAFESVSGFITRPAAFRLITSVGGFKLDVSNIQAGPVGTVARILVSTKKIVGFTGDYENQTFFTVPNGRIADNVTTIKTIDFFDADLVDDITYTLEQVETIEAGVGIGLYNGRMIVWGTDLNDSIAYVSKSGQPESINAIEGFTTINPGDAGAGLKNCWEHRGQLVCQKSQRTYVTQDNGEEAAFWDVTLIDASIGTGPHGVGQVLDFGFIVQDYVFVAHTSGVYLYNGIFKDSPITYGITDIWDRINKKYFHTVEICINAIDNEIFIVVPLDGATAPNYIIYGDYTEGMEAATVKWDLWKFPHNPQSMVVDIDNVNEEAVPKIGMYTGNVYKLDETIHDDYGTAVEAFHEHALLPLDTDTINHFAGVRVKAKGVGSLLVTLRGLDSVDTLTANPITLALTSRRPLEGLFNFVNEKAAVKLRVNTFGHYYIITKFELFISQMWE